MITESKSEDLDRIMELWLDTNISAHSFIDSAYWKSNFNLVKDLISSAIIYVYKENDVIQGFVGLMNDYIAGIFVSQPFQSKGIGTQLLDYVKSKKRSIVAKRI